MKLSKEDREKISAAVAEAESKTSGEIGTAIIAESYDYAIYELFFSVVVGFVYFLVLLFFHSSLENWLSSKFWDYNNVYLTAFYGFSTFLVITITYLFSNIPAIDRLICSKKVMQRKVHERALRHFVESGIYNTVHRTGILIFISVLEQRVELLADSGINELIPQEKWNDIVQKIVDGIKAKTATENLVEAIKICGDLLAENFPIQADDENELSNEIEVLER